MPFPSRSEYEASLYALPARYAEITMSTLHLYGTSATVAILRGEVEFTTKLRLRIMEVVDFRAGCIREYGYTLYYGRERIRWYDPQPHPENPLLQETFPHHYHEEPDIKHNRLPAHGIAFDQPNLQVLIETCLNLGKTINKP